MRRQIVYLVFPLAIVWLPACEPEEAVCIQVGDPAAAAVPAPAPNTGPCCFRAKVLATPMLGAHEGSVVIQTLTAHFAASVEVVDPMTSEHEKGEILQYGIHSITRFFDSSPFSLRRQEFIFQEGEPDDGFVLDADRRLRKASIRRIHVVTADGRRRSRGP